jgi:NAD+ synthase
LNREIIENLIRRDYESIQNQIGEFLQNEITYRKSTGVIFGLSGGIDSAVIAGLCQIQKSHQTVIQKMR